MHARGGLTTKYLGDKWFSCIEACLKKAKEFNMEAYAYDENGWPSGFAGGALLEDEENRDMYLSYEYGKYDEENFEQINAELEEYVRRTIGPEFLQVVRSFNDHSIFAVSALGCNPTGSALPRGVSPMRVEDPFLWLLSKEGLR